MFVPYMYDMTWSGNQDRSYPRNLGKISAYHRVAYKSHKNIENCQFKKLGQAGRQCQNILSKVKGKLLCKQPPTTKKGTMPPGPLGVLEVTFKDATVSQKWVPHDQDPKGTGQCDLGYILCPLIPQSSISSTSHLNTLSMPGFSVSIGQSWLLTFACKIPYWAWVYSRIQIKEQKLELIVSSQACTEYLYNIK